MTALLNIPILLKEIVYLQIEMDKRMVMSHQQLQNTLTVLRVFINKKLKFWRITLDNARSTIGAFYLNTIRRRRSFGKVSHIALHLIKRMVEKLM
jgi:hypothetical protein